MRRLMTFLALLAVLLAFVLGGALLGRRPLDEAAQRQLSRVQVSRAERLAAVEVAVKAGAAVLLLGLTSGLGVAAVRWALRRAGTVYPNEAGLFPLFKLRLGRAVVVHDPNRAPTPTTVYVAGGERPDVRVLHVTQDGNEAGQHRVTSQAQAVQAIAAATHRGGMTRQARHLVERLAEPSPLSAPLPEVEVLDVEPAHVERLLLDEGEAGHV
jgi:hypothetical protein